MALDADAPLDYEVKATTGGDTEFELIPIEQSGARKRRLDGRYRIVWVPHVTDGSQTQPAPVPNPLCAAGGRYLGDGTAVSYRSAFADSPAGEEEP